MAYPHNELRPRLLPTFGEAARFWIKLGFINFGGPTGQIAIMQTELVDRRRWISSNHFLQILNYCMLPAGPEAMQLATYVGWLLHRIPGGLMAGASLSSLHLHHCWQSLTFMPPMARCRGSPPLLWPEAGVLAIVVNATLRIGRRALGHPLNILLPRPLSGRSSSSRPPFL